MMRCAVTSGDRQGHRCVCHKGASSHQRAHAHWRWQARYWRFSTQPAKALKGCFPFRTWRLYCKGRHAAGFDEATGQCETAVIEFLRQLRVGNAKIRRCNEDALRCEAGETPAKSGPMRRRRLNLRQACATASPQRCGVSLNATATLSFSVFKFIRNGPDKAGPSFHGMMYRNAGFQISESCILRIVDNGESSVNHNGRRAPIMPNSSILISSC